MRKLIPIGGAIVVDTVMYMHIRTMCFDFARFPDKCGIKQILRVGETISKPNINTSQHVNEINF